METESGLTRQESNEIPPETVGSTTEKPPKRGPGRPRKVKTTVLREEMGDDDAGSQLSASPLFQFGASDDFDHIDIYRKGPVEEGLVGKLDPTDSESVILERWGGGSFRMEAKTTAGKIISKGVRMVRLAGDPIFMSRDAQTRWERMNPDVKSNGSNLNIMEVLQMMEAREQTTRKEAETREDSRRTREQDEYNRRRQEDREFEERKRVDERSYEEKRKREDDERDRKRRLDDEERERKIRVEGEDREKRAAREREDMENRRSDREKQSLSQTQDFYKSMFALNQDNTAKSDPMDQFGKLITAFAAVKETFGAEGGAADIDDPWMMLVKQLPTILNHGLPAIGRAVSEVQSGGAQTAKQIVGPNGQPIRQQAPQQQPQQPQVTGVNLPPELEPKFVALAQKWIAEGKNPSFMFNQVVDNLMRADVPREQYPAKQNAAPVQEQGQEQGPTFAKRRTQHQFRRVG